MKKSNTAERLRLAMENSGLRQVDVLDLCRPFCKKYEVKMNKSDISQYLAGKTEPNQDKLAILSMALDVSESWLMGFDVPPDRVNVVPVSAEDVIGEDSVRIPILSRVAAGLPFEACDTEDEWEEIPEDWLRGGREFFGLRVSGDSMYPEYLNNDIVIIEKTSSYRSGDDCVVYVNGYDATLKTVIKHNDGSITLQPINPSYPPRTYSAREIKTGPIVVCGVVVELRRRRKSR